MRPNDPPLVSQTRPYVHSNPKQAGPSGLLRMPPQLPRQRNRLLRRHVSRDRGPPHRHVYPYALPFPLHRTLPRPENNGQQKLSQRLSAGPRCSLHSYSHEADCFVSRDAGFFQYRD